MKRIRLFARVVLFATLFVMLSMTVALTTSADSDEGPLGMYVGGGVGGVVQGNAVGEVFVGHWWDNFAVEGGISYFKSKLDLEFDEEEATADKSHRLRVGVSAKAGQSLGRVKPYMGFGIRYEAFKNNSDFQPRVKGDVV